MILDYIKKLLFEHNCVIIPNFGGFITNYATASVHPVSNFLKPPIKKLAFNQSLQSNDGLLINTIAIEEKISLEEALTRVSYFVRKIENQLKQGEIVVLEGIGTLQYNEEERIQFISDESVNYLEESFGLTELYFKPIDREEEDMKRIRPIQGRPVVRRAPMKNVVQGTASIQENEHQEDVPQENQEQNQEQQASFVTDELVLDATDTAQETVVQSAPVSVDKNADRKTKKKGKQGSESEDKAAKKKEAKSILFLIIPAVLILGAGATYYFVNKHKKAAEQEEIELVDAGTSSNEASVMNAVTETSTPKTEEVVNQPVTENTHEPISVNEPAPVVDNTPKVEHTPKATTTASVASHSTLKHGKAYIIAGVFSQERKAQKFASQIGGATILPDGDKFRVSLGEYANKTEAKQQLENFKAQHGDNLWILEY